MMQDVEVWYLTSILPVPEGFINENQPIRRFGYGDRWLFFLCWDIPAFPGKRKRCMQPRHTVEVFTTAARLCIISSGPSAVWAVSFSKDSL